MKIEQKVVAVINPIFMNSINKLIFLILISLKGFGQQDPPLVKINNGETLKFEQYLFSAINADSTKNKIDSLCCSIDVFAKFNVKKGTISPIVYSESTPAIIQTLVSKLILNTASYWKEIEDTNYLLPLSLSISSGNCNISNPKEMMSSNELISHRAFWSIQSKQSDIDEKVIWLMKNERFKGVILHVVRITKR